MEMHEILKEKENTKEDEKASKLMLEVKTEEEVEPGHYSKLQNLPEDIYSEACLSDFPAKTKAGKQTEGNARLFRAGCLFLTIICLVLLLVVIILAMKLQAGSTICPEREEIPATNSGPTCDYEQCQNQLINLQPHRLGCQQCADGWLTFGRTCFYLSTFRLSWDKSQMNCTARGGSLAVITSQSIQRFLTRRGILKYWIGLRHEADTWKWVNNTALQKSYWTDGMSQGDCGILSSEDPSEKNWIKAPCEAFSYFICQVEF
ncbi:early activation antigen CD69 isoform X1 [Seriola aureovittata]|uniref:early activation antigen CD69 isoform X1 n=1 Tax=Seriola aureovittata TaxID=2871759 RepID=UPI0024BE62EC|nr:early activation antigen CD69 isoform X1 [Seriola aureovittata]